MESEEAVDEQEDVINSEEFNEEIAAYIKQRERANERKRRFLEKMTPEQKEIKKAKDREYYHRKKNERKKSIKDLPEEEKVGLRNTWRKNSKNYRERQKAFVNEIMSRPQSTINNGIRTPSCSKINNDKGK